MTDPMHAPHAPAPGTLVQLGRIAFIDVLGALPRASIILRESGHSWFSDIGDDEMTYFVFHGPHPVPRPVQSDDEAGEVLARGKGDFFIRLAGEVAENRYRVRNVGDKPWPL